MKKVLFILACTAVLIVAVSCSKKESDDASNGLAKKQIFTASDVVSIKDVNTDKLITVEEINDDGTFHIVKWTYEKNSNGEYEFEKQEQQYMDVTIDEDTEIIMGNVMAYEGKFLPLDLDTATSLEYFIDNATKTLNGKPLYFRAEIKRGHVDKIELFKELYIEGGNKDA